MRNEPQGRRLWAGAGEGARRTKAEDGRFVIGRDPRAESFVWVAGLGGHGLTCSWEIGRLAAEAVRAGGSPAASGFGPARLTHAEASPKVAVDTG